MAVKQRVVGWSADWFAHQKNGGPPASETTVHYTNAGSAICTFDGAQNPRWKDQVRNGINATTGATGRMYRVNKQDLFSAGGETLVTPTPPFTTPPPSFTKSDTYGYLSLSFPTADNVPSSTQNAVYNRALRKFLNQANAARSSIEAGQDIGEIKQTIAGIMNPLGSLRNHVLSYFPSVKKAVRKAKGLRGASKAITDTYLEWTFGWKPLVSDIADGVVALQNLHRHPETVPIQASAREQYAGSSTPTSEYPSYGSFKTEGYVANSSYYYVRFKGAVKTGAVNGSIPWQQAFQLDLPHFLPTVWDLLPYSFIVDYFVNIGDIINSVSFRYSDLSWACMTLRTKRLRNWALSRAVPAVPDNVGTFTTTRNVGLYAFGGNAETELTDFTRAYVTGADLLPRLQFSLPLKSGKPWLNMAAILAGKASECNVQKYIDTGSW